jgi:hypothetical protein
MLNDIFSDLIFSVISTSTIFHSRRRFSDWNDKDSIDVMNPKNIRGMSHNLYCLNHTNPETADGTSFSNKFEAIKCDLQLIVVLKDYMKTFSNHAVYFRQKRKESTRRCNSSSNFIQRSNKSIHLIANLVQLLIKWQQLV